MTSANTGLSCPFCGSFDTSVVDSRAAHIKLINQHTVRRRRLCADCKENWTTHEVNIAQLELALQNARLKYLRELGDRIDEIIGKELMTARIRNHEDH